MEALMSQASKELKNAEDILSLLETFFGIIRKTNSSFSSAAGLPSIANFSLQKAFEIGRYSRGSHVTPPKS